MSDGPILKDTLSRFSHRGGRLLGAGIAFYALLSVAPILFIALRVAALFTGAPAARAALASDLAFWVGEDGAVTVMSLVDRVRAPASASQVMVFLLLVYAATRLFSALKRAMHLMWDVPRPESGGVRGKVLGQLRKRGLALLLVVVLAFVLVGVVVARAAFSFAESSLDRPIPFAWPLLHTVGSIATTAALFSLLLRVLPDADVPWRSALEGGVLTALLFSFGTALVSAYVGHKGVTETYGPAGSVVVLLLWTYYSAQIFLLGVALTGERMRRAAGKP